MGDCFLFEHHHVRCAVAVVAAGLPRVAGLMAHFLHHTPADFPPVAQGLEEHTHVRISTSPLK
ncbi:MAG: hypothetical protein EOP03_00610 [Proteobacteria bacterium]|nr:MAG: hypothetical protein EOP03_00610 [Pseudomonadota bacterium]